MEVPMRKLAIGMLAAAGVAIAAPAAAQVVYETAPAQIVVTPSYGTYGYVVPQAPSHVYSYNNGDYGYTKYSYPGGCRVTIIRDYGQVTAERNCY
jgi:hypothetical protein